MCSTRPSARGAKLRRVAERCPLDRSQMLEVTGVGPVKFERYGDAFLDVLSQQVE